MNVIGIVSLMCLVVAVVASPVPDCENACHNNVKLAVCICYTSSPGVCEWAESYCIWEKCYSNSHFVAPSSKCNKDTRPETTVIKDGIIPPYKDNSHNY